MRWRHLAEATGAVVLALTLCGVLSQVTTRVVNWFVMTDELYYERLAISVAQTGSLLPRLHDQVIANVNQLYPILLSTVYGNADVPASLAAAHRLNAFVMASASIPVYLLARRVGVGWLLGLWVAALAVAVPWIVLASFLLTEVVAYPAFCWSLLALTYAVERKSALADALALASIGLAVLARTQFALLLGVFAVAVVAEALLTAAGEGRRGRTLVRSAAATLARTRRPLLAVYLLGVLLLVATAVSGDLSRLLGSYAVTATGLRVDLDLLRLTAEHVAVLGLGLAILPFLVGVGWLIDRLRPTASAAERALALVGCTTLVLMTIQVASFNQRFGAEFVKDRYLFYVVPVVLVALFAAVSSSRAPRAWTFLAPAVACAAGFATMPFSRYEKLNVDSPLAMLNDGIVRIATSVDWAHALLVLATVVAVQLLLVAPALLPWRPIAVSVAVLASAALPLEAVYAFERLFRVNGTNGLPITLDQGGVFNWVDRNLGRDGRVTMLQYPVNPPDWWAGQGYWWDLEFWNESVVDSFDANAGPGPEPWTHLFDSRTGTAFRSLATQYLLVYETEARFRLAGRQVVYDRSAYVFEPSRPTRAAWVTGGIYPDGWLRPRTPATITVFPEPGQRTALRRFLTIRVVSPDNVETWPVTMRSNLERWEGMIPPNVTVDRVVSVCVPARGPGTVTIETPLVLSIYRDPTQAALTGETDRPAGLLLRSIALADETGALPGSTCP